LINSAFRSISWNLMCVLSIRICTTSNKIAGTFNTYLICTISFDCIFSAENNRSLFIRWRVADIFLSQISGCLYFGSGLEAGRLRPTLLYLLIFKVLMQFLIDKDGLKFISGLIVFTRRFVQRKYL
jgi:hypothetical protein